MTITLQESKRKLNLPATWTTMRYMAKAQYLVDTHQAKDYTEAKVLMRAPWQPKPTPKPAEPMWWEK